MWHAPPPDCLATRGIGPPTSSFTLPLAPLPGGKRVAGAFALEVPCAIRPSKFCPAALPFNTPLPFSLLTTGKRVAGPSALEMLCTACILCKLSLSPLPCRPPPCTTLSLALLIPYNCRQARGGSLRAGDAAGPRQKAAHDPGRQPPLTPNHGLPHCHRQHLGRGRQLIGRALQRLCRDSECLDRGWKWLGRGLRRLGRGCKWLGRGGGRRWCRNARRRGQGPAWSASHDAV